MSSPRTRSPPNDDHFNHNHHNYNHRNSNTMSSSAHSTGSTSERLSSDDSTLLLRGEKALCDRCLFEDTNNKDSRGEPRTTTITLPLIGLFRLVAGIIGLVTVVRLHRTVEEGWWPLEHRWLFALCWVVMLWNLFASLASAFGWAYWPSTRRTCGLPPISVIVNGHRVVSAGGPDEDDGVRRRRMKRVQCAVFDILLTVPSWVLLAVSQNFMDQFWGAHFVGLWPEMAGTIALLFAVQTFVGLSQLFNCVEAKIIGVELSVTDIYAREEAMHARLQV